MAIVNTGRFNYPVIPQTSANLAWSGIPSGHTLDAAAEQFALILEAPKAGTISKVMFPVGSVTTPGNVDVRLETVDATTGDPTGTLLATNTNGAQALSTANTSYTTTLTAGAVVTQGQRFAVVIAWASGNYQIRSASGNLGSSVLYPYNDHFTGAWVKVFCSPTFALEYSDGSYPPLDYGIAWSVFTTVTVNTGTTPDEIGSRFMVPVRMRVRGLYAYADFDGDADLLLYDAASSVLASNSMDKDIRASTSPGVQRGTFAASVTLTPNAVYRAILKPTSVTSLAVAVMDLPAAAVREAMPGGLDWQYTSRTDAGVWTETTTRYMPIGLIVDGLDDGGSHFIGG